MTPMGAAEALAKLAKKIAWSPHSGLTGLHRILLRQAVAEYEKAQRRPTAFDLVLSDDDPFEKESAVSRCAYSKCQVPMMTFRHSRRKYHSDECRKRAHLERKKADEQATQTQAHTEATPDVQPRRTRP